VCSRAPISRRLPIWRASGNLWVLSDEAYEDVVFEGEHISIASLPGMYERTIPLYTFSKTYAITGLRLAYLAVRDQTIRDRVRKMLFYTVSNTSSLVQYGGVGALAGSQDVVAGFRTELAARRDLFYAGIKRVAGDVFSGTPTGRRVLCVPENQSRMAVATSRCAGVTVVGDDRVPDQTRPHRLCARRRLRADRRGSCPVLLCARSSGAQRRTGVDGDGVGEQLGQSPKAREHAPAHQSIQVSSAIHPNRLPRHEVALDQREHGLDDLVHAAPAAQWRRFHDGL
jgi:hypothetical protein